MHFGMLAIDLDEKHNYLIITIKQRKILVFNLYTLSP